MMQHYFQGRRILIGITGSIAAYKTLGLISNLRQWGAEVRVIMTESAAQFVTPCSVTTLCQYKVYTHLFDDPLLHIDIAKWAELILIVPATAHFMAQYAHGLAPDLLGSALLATQAQVVLVPAMNQAMWSHPATQDNAKLLMSRNVEFIGPESGLQACGDIGLGRMAEVDAILARLPRFWQAQNWAGKKVLITAGRTEEALDPVRYLSNHSSGKMGYALARSAYYQGAEVILVSGLSTLPPPDFCKVISVKTAQEMTDAVLKNIQGVDVMIGCAALCDFKPQAYQAQKIKKNSHALSLPLIQNPDLLAMVGALSPKPFLVGFAAETENLIINAQKKREAKQADMMIANEVGPDLGFNQAENKGVILSAQSVEYLPKCAKALLVSGGAKARIDGEVIWG